ncbi:MAG: hypothetical protein WKF73_11585 [Nocardioidaceae bacterium]
MTDTRFDHDPLLSDQLRALVPEPPSPTEIWSQKETSRAKRRRRVRNTASASLATVLGVGALVVVSGSLRPPSDPPNLAPAASEQIATTTDYATALSCPEGKGVDQGSLWPDDARVEGSLFQVASDYVSVAYPAAKLTTVVVSESDREARAIGLRPDDSMAVDVALRDDGVGWKVTEYSVCTH